MHKDCLALKTKKIKEVLSMNDNLSFGNYPNKFEQFSARGETFLFEAPMDHALILDATPQKL